MDYGHEQADKLLKDVEKKIQAEYKQAAKEVEQKLDGYLSKFKENDAKMSKMMKAGEITRKEYTDWRTKQIMLTDKWTKMRDELTDVYMNADKVASGLINDHKLEVYALNHNYGTYEVEKGAKIDTNYTLYDKGTVSRLAKDNPQLLPSPGKATSEAIRRGELKRWNQQHIQSAMMQSVLQGESIPKIAKRLSTTVGGMLTREAISYARTMTTSAENAGRLDSYKRAEDIGIKMMKQWLSAHDGRVRRSHREVDGEAVPVDQPFSNDLMYPGDMDGPPEEVYNCRCTLIGGFDGFMEDFANTFQPAGYGSYEEWKTEHDELSSSRGTEPTGTKEKIISDEALVEKVKKLPQKFGEVDNMIKVVDDDIAMESARKFNALREKGTDKIEDYKLKSIPFSELETRQKWLDIEKLEDMAESGKLTEIASQDRMDVIRAIEYKGHTILIDGNHRANLLKLKGHKRIMVYVRKVG